MSQDQTNKSIECCEKCKGKKSEARGVLNRCEYILCPCHLSASKEEANYLHPLTPSCRGKCGRLESHNTEYKCLSLAAYKSFLREKIEGMKRKKGSDDYVLSDQNAWYNQALNEVLKIIRG